MSSNADAQLGCMAAGAAAVIMVVIFVVFYVLPTVIFVGAMVGAAVSLWNFIVSAYLVYRERIKSNKNVAL